MMVYSTFNSLGDYDFLIDTFFFGNSFIKLLDAFDAAFIEIKDKSFYYFYILLLMNFCFSPNSFFSIILSYLSKFYFDFDFVVLSYILLILYAFLLNSSFGSTTL